MNGKDGEYGKDGEAQSALAIFFSVVLLLAKSGCGADSGFLTFWREIAICGHNLLNGGMLLFWGF